MKTISVTKQFSYSIDGMHVSTFAPGEHEVPVEVAEFATRQGYTAKSAKADTPEATNANPVLTPEVTTPQAAAKAGKAAKKK